MKLTMLLAAISFAAATAGATDLKTTALPQSTIDILHNAFLGANNLSFAETIAGGAQVQGPVPADVQALAQQLKGTCVIAQSVNNVQTINGSTCPISDTNSYKFNGDQKSLAFQNADSLQVTNPKMRAQLTVVASTDSFAGTQTQTDTTFTTNAKDHNEVVTVTNHKIVLDYTEVSSGTYKNQPNGATETTVQHVNISGTLVFDGQNHTGSLVYDAGQYNKQATCAVDGAPIDCQTFSYIFGFVQPSFIRNRL